MDRSFKKVAVWISSALVLSLLISVAVSHQQRGQEPAAVARPKSIKGALGKTNTKGSRSSAASPSTSTVRNDTAKPRLRGILATRVVYAVLAMLFIAIVSLAFYFAISFTQHSTFNPDKRPPDQPSFDTPRPESSRTAVIAVSVVGSLFAVGLVVAGVVTVARRHARACDRTGAPAGPVLQVNYPPHEMEKLEKLHRERVNIMMTEHHHKFCEANRVCKYDISLLIERRDMFQRSIRRAAEEVMTKDDKAILAELRKMIMTFDKNVEYLIWLMDRVEALLEEYSEPWRGFADDEFDMKQLEERRPIIIPTEEGIREANRIEEERQQKIYDYNCALESMFSKADPILKEAARFTQIASKLDGDIKNGFLHLDIELR